LYSWWADGEFPSQLVNKNGIVYRDGSYFVVDDINHIISSKSSQGDTTTIDKNGVDIKDRYGDECKTTSSGITITTQFGDTITIDSNGIQIAPATGRFLNLGANPVQFCNNFPNCLFTGAPHSSSKDTKA
jgi:hypothetical protein